MSYFRLRALLVLGGVCLFVPGAEAAISSTTGSMTEIFSPISFIEGDSESSTMILILDEGSTTLASDIFVNAVGPGSHFGSSGTAVPISAGTLVNSYLVHFDPIGLILAMLSGEVFFDPGETILGIQTHTPLLDAADGVVGDPMATYPTGLLEFRAFEGLPCCDSVIISGGLDSALFTLAAELAIDEARIITTVVPEPSTVTLLGLGLVALSMGRGSARIARSREH